MSYILEALKKSERQRRLGTVPRLDTPQEPTPAVAASRPTPAWLRPLLVFNLLLVLGVVGYLGLFKPWLSPLPGESGWTPGSPVQTDKAAVRPAQSGMGSEIISEEPARLAAATQLGPQSQSAPEDEAVAVAEVVASATPVRDPLPAEELLPPLAVAGPPPRWSELPDNLRERIVPPPLEVHVYSESPARRFVMVAGRQYREGDRLPEGLRLDEITPDGVLLSWYGEQFRWDR